MYYYVGTVILRMSSREFWKCTPKKLAALCECHTKLNAPKNKKVTTIDGVPQTSNPTAKERHVGAPTTFIDQM